MSGVFADGQLAAWVQSTADLGELDVGAMRAGIAERARTRTPGPRMEAVVELTIGGLAARLYRPAAGALPLVLYLHGGGWSIGSLESHDRMCRRLARGSGAAVLALDYRLAPEHPWPASVQDTVAALRWIASAAGSAQLGETTGRVAVAGDSAGGALAALASVCLRDEDDTAALPDLHVLLYANTDLAGSEPSMREKDSGWGLDVELIRFFNRQWVPDESRWADPGVSVLYTPDLTGMPPALIVSAEHDPLRDEAAAYASRLRDAGVDVELRCEPGLTHNFMLLDEISPACRAAADRIAADLHARLFDS